MQPGARTHKLISLSWADGVSCGTELYHLVGLMDWERQCAITAVLLVQARAWFASGLHWPFEEGLVFISFSTKKRKAAMWICGGEVAGGSLCHQHCLTMKRDRVMYCESHSYHGTAFAAGPHLWRCSWLMNNEQIMKSWRGTKLLQGCCGEARLSKQWRKTIIHVFLTVTLKLFNILNHFK